MTRRITQSLSFEVEFGSPIQFVHLEANKKSLLRHGIYFLCQGIATLDDFEPDDSRVVYIGKAPNETILSRCRKHKIAWQHDLSTPFPSGIRPGRQFLAYRSHPNFNLASMYLIPGFMDGELYGPTCAEEYFLCQFAKQNGAPPRANTAHVQSKT